MYDHFPYKDEVKQLLNGVDISLTKEDLNALNDYFKDLEEAPMKTIIIDE